MQMTLKRMKIDHRASIKDLTKKLMAVEDGKIDKSECVPTDNKPITKAIYDLDALRVNVGMKHP